MSGAFYNQLGWKIVRLSLCMMFYLLVIFFLFPGHSTLAVGETRTEAHTSDESLIVSSTGADIFIESLTVLPRSTSFSSRIATVVIKNRGAATLSDFYLDFYHNEETAPAPGKVGNQWVFIPDIAPGETLTKTFNFSATSGSSYAWAQAQTTQTRNGEQPIFGPYHYYNGYSSPSFSPAEIIIDSFTVLPGISDLGDELIATIVVRNVGDLETDNHFWVDFYSNRSTAPSQGDLGDRITTVSAGFAPGGYEIISFKITPTSTGTKQAWAQADTINQVSGAVVEGPIPYDVVEVSDTEQPLINLSIGSRVVDESWDWEFKKGSNYSGSGVTKPVTWIVVAKHHYPDSLGVTLLAEELIGLYTFDNSTDGTHSGAENGYNFWPDTGKGNATHGLRPWLNSSGIHQGDGFYQAFSTSFKEAIVSSQILTRHWLVGASYWTWDDVFIPSTTELGDIEHLNVIEIGYAYPYFLGAADADRIAELDGAPTIYWTRSPSLTGLGGAGVRRVGADGMFNYYSYANRSDRGVRPALTLSAHTPVSLTPTAGVYTIIPPPEEPFADIVIESMTVEPSPSAPGTELTATIVLKNNGNIASKGFPLDFYIHRDTFPTSFSTWDYQKYINKIDPGATRTETFTFTRLETGKYKAWAMGRTNQTIGQKYPVYGPVSYTVVEEDFVDFVIESMTIEPSISTLGTELTATLVVKNEGNVPTPSAELIFFWNRVDPPQNREGGSLYTGLASGIAPGDTRTITRNFTPGFAGEKQAWAFINTDQTSTGDPPVYGPVPYTVIVEGDGLLQSFTDVPPTMQFFPYIEAIYAEGITTGYSDGTYRPNEPVTRGQMAAFLSRALSLPDAGDPGNPSFTDVAPTMQFFDYIEAIYAEGITTGYGDGTYRPNELVTRGQMAAFLSRALGLPDAGDPNNPTFTDVSPTMQFFPYIEAIYAEGITTGYSDGTYRPNDTVTRGQMAAFWARALGL